MGRLGKAALWDVSVVLVSYVLILRLGQKERERNAERTIKYRVLVGVLTAFPGLRCRYLSSFILIAASLSFQAYTAIPNVLYKEDKHLPGSGKFNSTKRIVQQ